MKDLGIAAGLVGLALALCAGIVFGLEDENTFVPPPEIVAEEFVRALADGRVESARSMLASESERATSTSEVRRVSRTWRSDIGRLEDVKTKVVERRRDTVIVDARIEGERASSELTLPLVRKYGAWAVARLSEVQRPVRKPAPR